MATVKGKPRGFFEYVLAIDCETTGLFFNVDDPSYDPKNDKTHQALSWGIIVADAQTLKPIEKLYLEIKWNGESEWNKKAENIHGMSKEYLEENGVTEEDAAVAIANLILKYWGPENKICLLGHNVVTFDMFFLKRLMRKFEIELKFGNRHIDTFSVGNVTMEIFNSDDLFEECGMETRGKHNAMEDIEYTLESARRIRLIFQSALED